MGRDRGAARPAGAARPRYRRIATALTALLVTLVAVLGATGVLPTSLRQPDAFAADGAADGGGPALDGDGSAADGAISLSVAERGQVSPEPSTAPPEPSTALPEPSGDGKRVVFDISAQRVWLVSAGEKVQRTYLVSGSLTDNLKPGTYSVYSRSRHAIGVDDSGVMQYMVRFAHGNNAAIGFHDIPQLHGRLLQTRAQLGTPQSHGCVRQWRPDAKALWRFAPVGTTVVVLA